MVNDERKDRQKVKATLPVYTYSKLFNVINNFRNKDDYKAVALSYKSQQRIILVSFMIIPMILLFMFLIYPTFRMTFMSFTNWDGVLPTKEFVGLDNYKKVFAFDEAWLSLRNNIYYIINGFVQNIIALAFAIFLTSKLRGKSIFRVIIFLTFIINSAAVGFMFSYLYDFERGPLNAILNLIGFESIRFLSAPKIVNFSCVAVSMWRYTGYTMMLYIAALQSVSVELYEAAIVDGATAWQRFKNITLPSIRRIIELNLFLTMSGGLQAYAEPMIMTKGGPGNASKTFLLYIVDTAFKFNRYGLAASLSVTLFILILLITIIQKRVVLRGEK